MNYQPILNFYWPPMHRREVIAAGGGTLTDTLHIVWAAMTLLIMMLQMIYGSIALGKRFRRYTMAAFVINFLLDLGYNIP